MSEQSISAEEFDRRFDKGEDISDYIDFDSVRFPGREQKSASPETVSISDGYIIGSALVAGSNNTVNVHSVTINSEKQKTLGQAAEELQKLLQQLDKSYPSKTVTQQTFVAGKVIEEIDANSTLKQKIIAAVKNIGIEAFMEMINHPVANILRAGIESWQNKN